jgi:hypothetical protein
MNSDVIKIITEKVMESAKAKSINGFGIGISKTTMMIRTPTANDISALLIRSAKLGAVALNSIAAAILFSPIGKWKKH